MPPRSARLALLALLLGPSACGDPPPIVDDTDGRIDVDARAIDGNDIDTPDVEIDAGIDSALDSPIDSPIDTPPPLPRWGVVFPGETALSVATVGARTYVLSREDDTDEMKLHVVVNRQVSSTQTLAPGSGRLDTDGQSLYIYLQLYGAEQLWGESVGTAGQVTLVVAKLDDALAPRWRYVDDNSLAYPVGFDVDATGDVVVGVQRRIGNTYMSQLYVLASATGVAGNYRNLPSIHSVAISNTGKIFVGGALIQGETLNGHTATESESYLLKLVSSSVSFTRFDPPYRHLVGLYDGDPIVVGTENGRRFVTRHSGASGAVLWTTRYDAGAFTDQHISPAGTGGLYLYGGFQDRVDFTPSLRLETAGDWDFYVAELDATTGAVRSAQQFGSTAQDYIVKVEHGTCPLVGGTLDGPLTTGAGTLSVPSGSHGSFVATACPPSM